MSKFRVAAVQIESTPDKQHNLATAERLIADAAKQGAQFAVLPETFNLVGTHEERLAGAEPVEGHTLAWARGVAKQYAIALLAGSFCEGAPDQSRVYNTSVLLSPAGEILGVYRKIHLFDVDVPGVVGHESDTIVPGDQIVVASAGALTVGMSVCYDLRFPELYRILTLRGATVLTIPAAFTAQTGPAHWEVLLRARAIENQAFVIAAGQLGAKWHAHSMIVDPWGTILAQAPNLECAIVADLDLDDQKHIRQILPSLANRRPQIYSKQWPQE